MRRNAFPKIPVVGVEDGRFKKGITRKAKLVAVLLLGTKIEDARATNITVDGMDATEGLLKMIKGWSFGAVLLSGVSFAGFNIIDPTVIHESYGKPVVVVSRTKPDNAAVKRALIRHFKDWKMRWSIFEKLGKVYEIKVVEDAEPVYIEVIGETFAWACTLMRAFSFCGRMPEPLRVARLIARGIS
ncbi:MAG: DUF99 family protein [Candidatus Bathyarchaeia archaeon]